MQRLRHVTVVNFKKKKWWSFNSYFSVETLNILNRTSDLETQRQITSAFHFFYVQLYK